MRRLPAISLDPMTFLQVFAAGLRAEFADAACAPVPEYLAALMRQLMGIVTNTQGKGANMEQAQQNRRAVLVVEDDAELRRFAARLLEDGELDTIECESAEAALATMLISGRDVALIFADIRLPGVMDGIDLAREVRMRWPLLPVILMSGHPRDAQLPPGVDFMPKPWQPLNLLVAAKQALTCL
jgi:CheY-like chemotaxis protein